MLLSSALMSFVACVFPSRLLYASYVPAFVTTGFPGIGILGALTYTDLPKISLWRLQSQLRSQGEPAGPHQCGQRKGPPIANHDTFDATTHQTSSDQTAQPNSPDRAVLDIARADELEGAVHRQQEVQPTRLARWDDEGPAHLIV
eukprot:6194023-Pleurochrysis_carterae.AAC.1